MLPDVHLVPSTSGKCHTSMEIQLPDVVGLFGAPRLSSVSMAPRETPEKQQKPMNRGQCPSNCKVCRHPATGYHYDVPSCNGCKTFFRRSILDGRKYTCLKMKKCMSGEDPVDLTRRMCRACRFEKCVDSGMNPSAIQADVKSSDGEELKKEIMRKQKTSEGLNSVQILSTFNERVQEIIERLTEIEMKIEPLYTGGLPVGYKDIRSLEDVVNSPVTLQSDEIPNLLYSPCYADRKTGEIKVTSGCFIHTGLLATLEYSKMFEFGQKIDFASKMILLKHATIMCSDMMAAFFSYNQLKSDKLVHPNGQTSGPPKVKYGECGVKHQARMQKTLITVLSNKVNRVEYLLLKAIVLCNPAVCGLSPLVQQVIGKEREMYVRSLLTYCLLNLGTMHGPARFSALISITTVLENQQKNAKDFHLFAKAAFRKQQGIELKRISTLYEQLMES